MTISVYTVAQLRAIEQQAAATMPAGTLMQRAGNVAATWIARRFAPARRALVVCGPGNNGGDGYVCARSLKALGREVMCVALAPPSAADVHATSLQWHQNGGDTLARMPADLDSWDVVVDAMFGIGLARPLAGAYLTASTAMRASRDRVVALDLPSGLQADTGAWVGGVAGVYAGSTVSFLGAKPALFTAAGVDACGHLLIDSLGVPLPAGTGRVIDPEQFPSLVVPRARNTHKGSFGQLLVIGGAKAMVGAPLLAARAALRLGAGRVYVDVIGGGITVDPVMPELMFRVAATLNDIDAVVIGCGMGRDAIARDHLTAAIARNCACVIDADGLNLLADNATLAAQLCSRIAPCVLTPHPLEASRLLQSDVAAVQADRIGAARALAQRFGHWVVLKGAGTVVAYRDAFWINPTGSAALATAGTGDVLAGFIGALLAQGHDAQSAVLGAVWLHGRAADDFGQDVGLVASDLGALASRALAELRASAS